jgi:hypothetical protein
LQYGYDGAKTKRVGECVMISTTITYSYAVNNGYINLNTSDEGYFDFEVKDYMEGNLDYVSSEELIELGEWLIAIGKGKK